MNIRNLKEGDFVEVVKPYSDRRVCFKVIRNLVDDVLLLHNENNDKTIHLFYDDETVKDLVVYIDPPYKGNTGYKSNVDLERVINNAKAVGATVYVSEYYNLSDDYEVLSKTTKGGISGDCKGNMVEYLSRI